MLRSEHLHVTCDTVHDAVNIRDPQIMRNQHLKNRWRCGEMMIVLNKNIHFVSEDIPPAGISCSRHEEYSGTKSGRRDIALNQQSDPHMSFFHLFPLIG